MNPRATDRVPFRDAVGGSYPVGVDLVEREPQLEHLRTALERSRTQGCVVAVSGEAGAGKSALVRVATTGQSLDPGGPRAV